MPNICEVVLMTVHVHIRNMHYDIDSLERTSGPRPVPLKVCKDSYKIRKPPLAPQTRYIMTVSPKVIHTNPSDFMNLVQRLTGSTSSTSYSGSLSLPPISTSNHPISTDTSGAISPAARFATIEKITKSPEGKKQQISEENFGFIEGIEMNPGVERTSFCDVIDVTVCQTCGDRGFSVALIYCDKCRAFAVHRYCLYKLPETFEEHVVWFCADCEPKVAESSTLQQALPATGLQSRSKKGSSVRESKGKNDIKKLKNNKNKKSKNGSGTLVISKAQRKSSPSLPATFEEHVVGFSADCDPKVSESSTLQQALPVAGFQSRLKKGSYVRKSKGKNDIKKSKNNKKKKKKSKYDSGSLAISKVQRQSSPSLRSPENLEKDETPRRSLGVGEPSSKKEAGLIEAKTLPSNTCTHSRRSDCFNIDEGAESVNNRKSLVATNEHLNIIEHSFLDPGWREPDGVYSDEAAECVNTKTSLVATSNRIPKHSYVPAQPIFEPIWRGCFHLSDENLIVGLIAHLSSLACLKVCKTAKCLPQLLRLESLPRCDVWPKGFKKLGPSEESIALYFFPNNERETKVFDSLVDNMIGRDLAMRAVVQDVELLVYTSNKLPLHCWRFQEKFYLWGVFRAKQASHLTNVVRGEEKNLVKALTWDSLSPVSPLSNSGSSLSG